jgi:hypothetical protein
MNRTDASGEFERWLDREVGATLAAELGPAAPPPRLLHRLPERPLGRTGVAGLGARGAAAVLAVVLAVAGGGAALATGSANPVSWGQQVVQAVSACADQSAAAAPPGAAARPDVGRCVGTLTGQRTPAPIPDATAAPPPPAARPPAPDSHRPQATDEPPDAGAGRAKQPDHGGAGPPADEGAAPKDKNHSPASSAAKSSDH